MRGKRYTCDVHWRAGAPATRMLHTGVSTCESWRRVKSRGKSCARMNMSTPIAAGKTIPRPGVSLSAQRVERHAS